MRTHPHPDLPDLQGDELADTLPDLSDIFQRIQTKADRIAPGRRLIAIVRVSKTNGREKLAEGFIAPEEQLGKCEGYADAHESTIVETRQELNTSGGKVDRKVLMAAVDDVLAGKADGIIVARVNRYARTTAGLEMVRRLQAAGKTFIAVEEGIGPEMLGGPFGWFSFTLMLAMAELQLGQIREGWLTARRHHIAAGIAAQVPYGYRKRAATEADRPRRLDPDPATAGHVLFIFERRAAGDSWITIAKALDAKGAPVPGGGACWPYHRVRGIVQNRTYLGELRSGEFVNEAAHLPLVTPTLWTTANAHNQTPARNGKANYPLTGILRCASCGGRMVGFMQTIRAGRKRDGEKRRYAYYRCRRRYSWGQCPAPVNVPARELEPLVVEEFLRRFTRDLEGVGRAEDRSAELSGAEAAVDAANAAVDRFLSSPSTERLAALRGQLWYDAELEKLTDELAVAMDARQEVRNSLTGMDLPEGLELAWPDLSCNEQRGFLSDAFGVVAIRRPAHHREPIADRLRIWARNESGSPEAKLAAGGDDGRIAMLPIDI